MTAFVSVLLLLAWTPNALAWAWPADGAVLQGFSVGDNPYAGGQHRGIDIAIEGRRAVRAPAAGEVTFAGSVPTHGLTVTIATGDGYKASLTHLGTLLVKKGAVVAEGAPIAESGPSGETEHGLPYLHLGIRVGNAETYVDPLSLLPRRGAPSTPVAPAPAPAPMPAPAPAPAPAPSPPAAAAPAPAPDPAPAPQPSPASRPVAPSASNDAGLTISGPASSRAARGGSGRAATGNRSGSNQERAHRLGSRKPQVRLHAERSSRLAVSLEATVHASTRRLRPAVTRTSRPNPGVSRRRAVHRVTAHVRPALHAAQMRAADRRAPHVAPGAPRSILTAPMTAVALGAVLALGLAGCARVLAKRRAKAARIMAGDVAGSENPCRSRVAVRLRPAPHRPRGGLRRSIRHLRPLPPTARQFGPDDQWNGRARHARDGRGGRRGRVPC